MLFILLTLLSPPVPPVVDVPPVKAGTWVERKVKPVSDWKVLYNQVADRVADGETVVVIVGQDYHGAVRIDGAEELLKKKGLFRFFRNELGKSMMEELEFADDAPLIPRLFSPPLVPVMFRSTCPGGNCPQTQPLYYSR